VIGAPQHMPAVLLARQTGIEMTVVNYLAGSLAQQDLLGGRIDAFMSHTDEVGPLAREGRTRLLAVSSPERLLDMPEVPTFAEQGVPDLTMTEAFCLMLPAATPAPLVTALNDAVRTAVEQPVAREGLARLEMAPMVLSPTATAARIRAEREHWGPIVRASGFSADD
jgi:tripartite-type tricarboxylate transporter receptor subunit TctC